jgi:hypothetical protein
MPRYGTPVKLIVFGFAILISSLGSWLANRSMKRKLRRGLGKTVARDADIFSISAWMKVDQKTLDTVVHEDSRSDKVIGKMENAAASYYGKRKRDD